MSIVGVILLSGVWSSIIAATATGTKKHGRVTDNGGGTLIGSAFCSSGSRTSSYPPSLPQFSFPIDFQFYADQDLWPWDATFDADTDIVEVTTLPSSTVCTFNHTAWKRLVSSFPQYAQELAYGDEKNVLIDGRTVDTNGAIPWRQKEELTNKSRTSSNNSSNNVKGKAKSLLGNAVKCSFFTADDVLVYTTNSFAIRSEGSWDSFSTLQIMCSCNSDTYPRSSWAKMSLQSLPLYNNKDENIRSAVTAHVITINSSSSSSRGSSPSSSVIGSQQQQQQMFSKNAERKKQGKEEAIENEEEEEKQVTKQSSTISSSKFSVCNVPKQWGNLGNRSSSGNTGHLYKLSVCTATLDIQMNTTVEWLEYHLLQGIQHFYIYYTGTGTSTGPGTAGPVAEYTKAARRPAAAVGGKEDHGGFAAARLVLQSYIEEGVVTLVPWQFDNCVKGMASGRAVHWNDPNLRGNSSYNAAAWDRTPYELFLPPKPIAQTAALASCYSRFRRSSQYIMHIDIDEYVLLYPGANSRTVVEYADRIFHKFTSSPAINLMPIVVTDCSDIKTKTKGGMLFDDATLLRATSRMAAVDFSTVSPLPRLGRMQYASGGSPHETKLIMRTDAVDMFFIHYITKFSDPTVWHQSKVYSPYVKKIALMHFKSSMLHSHSVFGSTLPFDASRSQRQLCRSSVRVQQLSLDRVKYSKTGVVHEEDLSNRNEYPNGPQVLYSELKSREFHHHRLNWDMTAQLITNYERRLLDIERRWRQQFK